MLDPRESHGSRSTDRSITRDPATVLEKRYRGLGYELGEEIGRGRTGVVHRAIHATTGIPVAVKRLRSVDAEGLHDLKREFRTLFGGAHRGIARVYELVADPDEPFFAMELIDGPELVGWVRGDHPIGTIDERLVGRVVDAVTQLCTTLAWLHRAGRVHRDVKPSNVRVQNGRVVLLDFDLAALVGGTHRKLSDSAGTMAYMPNEALWGGETTTTSDVYALGVLAYECLTGERAFTSTDPIRLHRDKSAGLPALPEAVPSWLDALLRQMTSPNANERPSAVEALAWLGRGSSGGASEDAGAPPPHESEGVTRQLVEAYRARDRSKPSLYCVAGLGSSQKARAVNELLRCATSESSCWILEGRCVPSTAVPFQGVDGIVDALADALCRAHEDDVRALVPREAEELLALFPVMRRVAAFAEAAPCEAKGGSAIDRRLRGFAGLRSVFDSLARSAPLLVVVDDLQWADGQSLRFWADMLAGTTPFVFVAVAEREDVFSALQLGEGGVAFDARFEPDGFEGDEMELIPALSHGAHRLLNACSLAFAPLDLQTLASATGEEHPLTPMLELIHVGGLIQHTALDPKMVFTPYGEGVRRAVERHLSPEARGSIHRALAEALGAGADDAHAVAAFWHWRAANEPETARAFASQAGARLMKRMAFEQAARVYEAALEGSDEHDALSLTQRLGEALEASGSGKAAAEAFSGAATLAEANAQSPGTVRALRRRSAEAFLRAGYIADGNHMLDEMLPEHRRMPKSNAGLMMFLMKERTKRVLSSSVAGATAEKVESSGELDALWSGTVGTVWADLSRSMYYQALHARFASKSAEPVHHARAMSAEGCYLAAISPRLFGPIAERLGTKSLAIAEGLGDPNLVAMARSTGAATSFLRGQWATTVDRCDALSAWVEHECNAAQWELSTAYLYGGWSLGFRGDLTAIERFRTKVLHRARAHDDRLALTCVSVGLPNLTWLARGRPDLARAGTREVMQKWSTPSYSPFHFFALFGETLTDLYCGNATEARARFDVDRIALRRSFLRHHPIVRPLLHYLNVKTALAAVQAASGRVDVAMLKRSARLSVWRLRVERAPWSRGFSHSARAIWDSMYRSRGAAVRQLVLSEEAFRGADMALYAEAAGYQRAAMSGGTPKRFTASVADPNAMARCLVPVSIR